MKLIVVSKNLVELNSEDIDSELQKEFGNQYNYVLISPEDKSYKIDEIKKFVRSTSFKKDSNTSKIICVITKGDSLTPIVQNSLLKTLEDSDSSIIILVKNPDSLLPTIKSRMQIKEIKSGKIKALLKENVIDFDSITSVSKLERSEVVKKLESLIDQLSPENIQTAIFYQQAIDKITANCKVEAVLVELINNLQ